jgi:hypothetical protein
MLDINQASRKFFTFAVSRLPFHVIAITTGKKLREVQ